MLDVHPPHSRIQGLRDFLLHLLTITIGLLIALGLEGCVEWARHRHLRDEADANLRQEIQDNQKQVAATSRALAQERQNLVNILKFLDARSKNQPYDTHALSVSFSLGTLHNASWRTASATGALSYMEYLHVQRFATAYQIQDQFSDLEAQTLSEFLQLQSFTVFEFDPNKMAADEAKEAGNEVRLALAHLIALGQIGEALTNAYGKALAVD